MKNITLMTVAFLVCCTSVLAKEKPVKDYEKILFGPSKMARVELQMPDTTWQTILKEARRKQYHLCAVTVNGERLDSVAIRTKGASSLDDVAGMKSNRYSFTLKLNHFKKGQKYHGLSKILLNNNIWDASQIKDAIVYDMARYMGLPAPLTNFAELRVNGQLQGYYLLANEQYKVRYYHYLDQLCSQYIQGGGMKKFLRTVNKQMGKKAGTEPNKFYTNKQFHAGVEMLANMLRRKAQSVLGQLDGTVPSTWDEQKQHPGKLINCDGINLRLTGGLGY